MTISITLPDALAPRIVDAFAGNFSYAMNAQPGETKAQFARRMIRDFVANNLATWEAKQAAANASAAATTAAASDLSSMTVG